MRIASLVLLSSLILIGVEPALGSEAEPNQILVENTEQSFVVGEPGKPNPQYSIEVLVSGAIPGELAISFVDTMEPGVSSPSLPSGSLPSSLTNVMQLQPANLSYQPNGTTQRFLLVFTVKRGYEFRAFFGNLRIAFDAGQSGSGGTSNSIGVVKNLLVTPFGWAGENPSEERTFSRIEKNLLTASSRSSLLDGLLPDLSFLINQGPVKATVRVTNPGTYPNNTWIEWRFFDGEVLLAKKRIPEEFIRGGKSLEASFLVTFTDDTTERTFDVLPAFRLLRYEVTVQSELSGFDYEPQNEVQYFVIAPWKEMLAGLLFALLGFLAARRIQLARKRKLPDTTESD
jgi:hypothetical protein